MKPTHNDNFAGTILVVEDDASLRSSLILNLELHGFIVTGCKNASSATEQFSSKSFDLIISDFLLPDASGVDFIEKCKKLAANSAIIITSGLGKTTEILEAIRAGADDFLAKPFMPEDLLFTVRKTLLLRNNKTLLSTKETSQQRKRKTTCVGSISKTIVAESAVMLEVFNTVERLVNFNTTILIVGESGTGKELLARAIHQNSPRKGHPFVAINCGAIPELLIESELFGHKKGAFTDAIRDKIGLFEEADGGTIFLDEIGELPVHLQVKLLRALQEKQIRRVGDDQLININVRVIAATLRDLEEDVSNGRFRDDLYYRLNVITIPIPPLRNRPEDIPILVKHFVKKHSKLLSISAKDIEPEVIECLKNHCWRGNVRELENCIERALVLSEGPSITIEDLAEHVRSNTGSNKAINLPSQISSDCLSIKQRSRELEIKLILQALEKTYGNRTHAAKILEISHRALLYKIKEYELN